MLSGIWRGFRPGQNRSLFCVGLHCLGLAVVSVFLMLGGPVQIHAANATNVEATVKLRVEGNGDQTQTEKPRDSRQDQFMESFPWKLAVPLLVLGWIVTSLGGAYIRYKESEKKHVLEVLSTLTKSALPPSQIASTIDELKLLIANLETLQKKLKGEAQPTEAPKGDSKP